MFNNGYPFFSWEDTGSAQTPTSSETPQENNDILQINNITYDCSINIFDTYENITTEVWKRILNNLPYLYKTKGTIRGLKALITCYGIPSSILYVREFGGPDLDISSSINEYKFDNFSYVLPFYATQSVEFAWHTSSLFSRYASTVQFRFSTTGSSYKTDNSMSIVEVPNSWSISILPTHDTFGKFKFTLYNGSTYTEVTSSEMPIYDGKYTFVNLQRESASDGLISQSFSLDAKKYTNGQILYAVSASLETSPTQNAAWRSSGSLLIGGYGSTFATPFRGTLDEFRLWETPLIERVIDTHVKFPESYIGNTLTGSFVDLLLRFSFDDPLNLTSFHTASFGNNAASNGYTPLGITFSGWSNDTQFPYNFTSAEYESAAHTLNIGINRYSNNKVRLEDSTLNGPLSSRRSVEVGEYDISQLDSNKLGIYFSPTDLINEDIIKTLAISDAGDLIGNPAELYSSSYSSLEQLSGLYWKLGSNRISTFDYLNYIKYYDPSLFDHIKSFIPARCQTVLGIMYEPTILERPKAKQVKSKFSQLDYGKTIDAPTNNITASYLNYDASMSINNNLNVTDFNFENDNIYTVITASNYYTGVSGSVYQQINPIVDFESNLIYASSSDIKTSTTQVYSFENGYNNRHYKYYEGFYTWERRVKYVGCLQNKQTTLDKLPAVEVWDTNPNRLISRDDGTSLLQVI